MIFTETKIRGVWIIDVEPRVDYRGMFARSWCARELAEHGIEMSIAQCNVSVNTKRGTLRGMHYQQEPHPERKVVRCTRGALYDVVVDLRESSPTKHQWVSAELTEDNHRAVYIPPGCAHGFQTLADDTEIEYQLSEFFYPDLYTGVRYDDPAFGIEWPVGDVIVIERDASYPLV
jgi:dTDP-4-dehydrorhamnose 3,5-epimerase